MQETPPGSLPAEASIDAVAAAIAAARSTDALAPVTVLVPSNYAGLSLRRALGRRHGLVNVGFMVPSRVAELLAASNLEPGRGPLTPAMRREAIRAVLAAAPEPFATIAGHASTVTALDSAFREIRALESDELARLRRHSRRSASLVALFEAFRERLSGYHDELDRARAAAEAIRHAPVGSPALGHIVAYLPRGLNPESDILYDALEARDRLTRVEAVSSEEASLDGRAAIQVVADEDEEVRAALRVIAAQLEEGRPLHRIAVLFPSPGFAARCFELFESAGIPCNGSTGGSLAGSIAGRSLLALLRLGERTVSRDDVLGALALPLPGIEHYADRWNALARDARITRGFERWRDRLEAHAARLRGEADAQPDEYESLRDRLLRDATVCDALMAAVARLEELAAVDHLRTWSGFTAWALAILDGIERRLDAPEQREHLDSVREIVGELGALDAFASPASPAVFLEALSAALGARRVSVRKFEHGVFAGSLDEAYGMTFDLAIVLGCTEGALPASPPEDPLLPAEDRGAVPALALWHRRHWLRQRQAFQWVLGGAAHMVFSFPRASLAGQRPNVPSPWLLEVASVLHGSAVYGSDLLRLLGAPDRPGWLRVTASFAAAIAQGGPRGCEAEWTLAAIAPYRAHLPTSPLVAALPELGRAAAAIADRTGPAFSEFDGLVGPEPGLAITGDPLVSPTRLEWWSQCGYRYFLASALRVTENELPADPEAIDPRDRGSLVHAILDQFFAEHAAGKPPSDPWSSDDLTALDRITDRHVELAARSGQLGRYVPWRVEEARMRSAVHGLLHKDAAWRSGNGLSYVASEYGFGRPEHRGRPGDASLEPIRIETTAGVVSFRGEIDRLDRASDGSLIVYDYKTGRPPAPKRFASTPFDDGARLQLPVYALAARGVHDAPYVRAAYWHLMHEKGPGDFVIPVDQVREAEFRSLLGHIAGGIAAGVFPARKSRAGTPDLCKYCPFDLICPVDRARAHERKRHDPAMAPYFLPGSADADGNAAVDDDDA